MLYLYLDESGDLGFDFFAKKPSKYFTVAILAIKEVEHNRALLKAVKKTIYRKMERRSSRELKGSHIHIGVKRYFYNLVSSLPFDIYALTLNKRRVYSELAQKKDRVYNFIARNVLDQVPFESASTRIQLIIDRSKNRREIGEFNDYIVSQLQGRLDPRVPLDIYHYTSHENLGLQAADLFSWGIYRKYEKNDREWFNIFREKVRYDDRYL
ncbi:MAG: DUF3800 domain-containing protein [Nitrospirota bacterium]